MKFITAAFAASLALPCGAVHAQSAWPAKSITLIDRMHAEVVKALATPQIKEIRAGQGSDTNTMSQEQFAQFVAREVKRWAEVTKASGAKLD